MDPINRKSKFSLLTKIVLLLVMLLVTAGLGKIALAADSTDDDNSLVLGDDQSQYFDPFTFETIRLMRSSGGGIGFYDVIRPPIRIPFKPVLRSPCKPPL